MEKIINLLCILFALAFSCSVHAQWAVFDASNYQKNLVTAAQSVKSVLQGAQQLQTQLLQLDSMQSNLRQLGGGVSQFQQQQLANRLTSIDQYISSAGSLYGNLNTARLQMVLRDREQAVSGLPWDAYLARENQISASRQDGLGFLRQQEVDTMNSVQNDYSVMQRLQQRIPELQGNLDAQQLMNLQMNVLIGQMADIKKLSAASSAASSTAAAQQVADQQRTAADAAALRAAQLARQQSEAADIQRLHGWNPFSTTNP